MSLLKEGVCLDDLMLSGLYIIQDSKAFKFGMDAVLLSGFAKVKKGERVIDLCSGNGIIPLLLSAKTKASEIIGVELQEPVAKMAMRSVEYNKDKLNERVKIICEDVKNTPEIYGYGSFDVVTCNPPYMKADAGIKNSGDLKTIARHEVSLTLDEMVKSTAVLLKTKGHCYFVHRPTRLTELMVSMHENNIEAKRMRMVYPFADKEPNMVLVEGVKDSKPYLVCEPPLIVYEEQDKYTKEILETYGY